MKLYPVLLLISSSCSSMVDASVLRGRRNKDASVSTRTDGNSSERTLRKLGESPTGPVPENKFYVNVQNIARILDVNGGWWEVKAESKASAGTTVNTLAWYEHKPEDSDGEMTPIRWIETGYDTHSLNLTDADDSTENQAMLVTFDLQEGQILRCPKQDRYACFFDSSLCPTDEDGDGCVSTEIDSVTSFQELYCSEKQIRIYKFGIQGNNDYGRHGEHKIKLNGERYYPNQLSDCKQTDKGFCYLREGRVHRLDNAPWRDVPSKQQITIGTDEHDFFFAGGVESYTMEVPESTWYLKDTCETYGIMLSRTFSKRNTKTASCFSLSKALRARVDTKSLSQHCEEAVLPSQSYVFYLEVRPRAAG